MSTLAEHEAAYMGPHAPLFLALPPAEREKLLQIYKDLAALDHGLSIAVGNMKGGVAKTTTSVYLALLLGLSGDSVLLVDADGENKQSLLWSAASVEWPSNVKVVAWAGADAAGKEITPKEMGDRIRIAKGRFRHLVVDTAPQLPEYLRRALREVDDFVITSSPYPLDTQKIMPSVELAADIEESTGRTIGVNVLIARAKKGTATLRDTFKQLEEDGVGYFAQPITNYEHYPLSPGTVPRTFDEYVDVLAQLIEQHKQVQA